MKYRCIFCQQEYELDPDMEFCPMCQNIIPPTVRQLFYQEQPSRMNEGSSRPLFGDANAISGGVNASTNYDSHNIHNTDSHNVTNNYVNQYERPKTEMELLSEKKEQFQKLFRQLCPSGYITEKDELLLKQKSISMSLDWEVAIQIIETEKRLIQQAYNQMGRREKETLDIISNAIDRNSLDLIKSLYPELEVMNNNFTDDRVQYYYYCATAALYPERLLHDSPSNLIVQPFWKRFWQSQTYRICNRKSDAITCLSELRRLPDLSEDKRLLLDCLMDMENSSLEILRNRALSEFQQLSNLNLDFLNTLVAAIGIHLGQLSFIPKCEFYLKYFTERTVEEKFELPRMHKINLL